MRRITLTLKGRVEAHVLNSSCKKVCPSHDAAQHAHRQELAHVEPASFRQLPMDSSERSAPELN